MYLNVSESVFAGLGSCFVVRERRGKDAKGPGTDMKESTKRNVQVGMTKGAKLTIVSTTLLIGIKFHFYESLQSSMYINPLFSSQLYY